VFTPNHAGVHGEMAHMSAPTGARYSVLTTIIVVTFTGLSALGANSGAHAADEAPAETVVTATRTETPLVDIATPVIVIDRDEIERSGASDLADLITGHAGIEVARNGGPGQYASLFLRGTNSDHTAVLVDGVRVNPGTFAGADLQNILPDSIERVEIVEGPRSALYGSDAIGGVINIITRAGAARGVSAYVADGRWNTRSAAVDGGADLGPDASIGGDVAWTKSDGFPPVVGSTSPGDYENRTGNAQVRVSAGEDWLLTGRAWRASGHTAYDDFGAAADEDFVDASYALQAGWKPSDAVSATFGVNRVQDQYLQNQSADYARTRRDSVDAQADWRTDAAQTVSAGVNLSLEDASSLLGSGSGFPSFYAAQTHMTQAFVQDQYHGTSDDLLLAGGYTHHETFGNRGTWNAEWVHQLAQDWRFSVAGGTAFHAPDANSRYGFGGNPALKPEFSQQWDAGLAWNAAPNQHWRLDAFQNHIDDLVEYVVTDPVSFAGEEENVDRSRIRGLTLSYEWRNELWQLRADGTLQQAIDLDTDQLLLRRARQYFSLYAGRRVGSVNVSATLRESGYREDFGVPDPVPMAGYALLDLAASWQVTSSWVLEARLDNAANRAYTLVNGYNTAGRSWTVAARYRFR
jgi:vitamin B12 transporter